MRRQAMLDLLVSIRKHKRDVFINCEFMFSTWLTGFQVTTGTWASPFWVFYCDSIWRGAEDVGHKGPGSEEQQWITFRDSVIFNNIVKVLWTLFQPHF